MRVILLVKNTIVFQIDRQYFPLLLYFILKWPAIKKELKLGKTVTPKHLVSNTRYCTESPVPIKIKIKDCGTQTEDYCELNDNCSEVSENISYKSITVDSTMEVEDLELYFEIPIKEECTFLRDTSCQTLNEYEFNKINGPLCQRSVRCCCLYGKNYESNLNESVILDKGCQTNLVEEEVEEITIEHQNKCDACTSTDQVLLSKNTQCDIKRIKPKHPFKIDVGTNTDDFPYYGWIIPSKSAESSPTKVELCSPKTFISDNQYIYDDYISSTLNLLDNPEDTASIEADNDLLDRISKIGWTYTPPRSIAANSPLISPTTLSKKTSKDENYTLCFNEKEQVKEEKEECSSRESLKSRQSLANVSSAKSRKSFIVANIKSKFDFFKIFSGKKNKLKGSCSYDSMSNIKYKKMNSARSTMF